MSASLNERVEHQWVGSFLVEQFRSKPEDQVPLLVVEDKEWNATTFARWFRAHQPEVIISQQEEVLDWLQQLGVRVPEEAGFVHLNCPDRKGRFAGIYQNGPTVGVAAVDFLVGMIHRNERGIPELAHSVLIEGTWVDGATLETR